MFSRLERPAEADDQRHQIGELGCCLVRCLVAEGGMEERTDILSGFEELPMCQLSLEVQSTHQAGDR